MFSTNGNDYIPVYKARQRELEAAAQRQRLVKTLTQNGNISPLRQHVGSLLIELGKKVAQDPQQDAHLVLSAHHH